MLLHFLKRCNFSEYHFWIPCRRRILNNFNVLYHVIMIIMKMVKIVITTIVPTFVTIIVTPSLPPTIHSNKLSYKPNPVTILV